MRWLATLVLLAGALAGCGEAEDHAEVACSISGQTRFAAAFLEGPEFTPEEFAAATQEGPVLAAFFLGGAGEPENHHYMASEGFTVVSEGLVLAYQNGIPFADFSIEDGGVHGWGGCRPNLVDVDLVAYRWVPLPPVDRDATAVGIGVEGGGCVVAGKTDIVTEVVSIEVTESDDRVEIIAWTRDIGDYEMCAGVGVQIDAVAELSAPLGDRVLVDAGTVPPMVVAPQP